MRLPAPAAARMVSGRFVGGDQHRLFGDVFGHGRVYRAGFDGDDANAVPPDAVAQRFQIGVERGFRGAVRGNAAPSSISRHRRDADDGSGLRPLETLRGLVQPGHPAQNVGLERQAVFVKGVLVYRRSGITPAA